MYTCWICNSGFETYESIRKHIGRKHKIHSSEVYVTLNLNGVWPICSCGCEEKLQWTNVGFRKYIWGHQSKTNNNWGHNNNAQIKSKETRKRMYKSGEIVVWNKGLTMDDPRVSKYVKNANIKTKGENISKALKGKKKTGISLIASRNNIMNFHKSNYFNKKNSKPELKFLDILKSLNINFIPQHPLTYLKSSYKIYDFYIPEFNTLIEVDGDYYHFNPKLYPDGPKYTLQLENIENDAIKNKLARDNGYNILRFWETDINENKDQVIDAILKITKENGRV